MSNLMSNWSKKPSSKSDPIVVKNWYLENIAADLDKSICQCLQNTSKNISVIYPGETHPDVLAIIEARYLKAGYQVMFSVSGKELNKQYFINLRP
jgi:hypothetical protein